MLFSCTFNLSFWCTLWNRYCFKQHRSIQTLRSNSHFNITLRIFIGFECTFFNLKVLLFCLQHSPRARSSLLFIRVEVIPLLWLKSILRHCFQEHFRSSKIQVGGVPEMFPYLARIITSAKLQRDRMALIVL